MAENTIKIATPEQIAAINKAAKMPKLDPGEYNVNFMAHFVGNIRKGEDYRQRLPVKADPWSLLAVAFSKMNSNTVNSIVRESLRVDRDYKDQIKAEANASIASIVEPTVTDCNGKTTADIHFDIII